MAKGRRNRGDRRRTRNFLEPSDTQASDSIAELVRAARNAAESDHRESFVSSRERDLIADVYLQRARARLADGDGDG